MPTFSLPDGASSASTHGAARAGRSSARRPALGRRPRRRWPRRLAATYAVVVVVLLVAWWVAGDAWWLQPFNLATFWWLVPSLPLAVAAGAARRPDVLAWLAVPVLAWAWIYGSAFLPGTASSATGQERITVVSYNTWVQADGVDHVVDLVEETDADVLLAMEVFPDRERRLRDALAERLPEVAAVQSEGVGGVLVAAAHPIVEVVEVDAGDGARRSLVATIDVDGRRVQVAVVHLRSPCPQCGDSLPRRLALEGRSRDHEVTAVLEQLDPGLPAIVGGDFNSTDRSMAYRHLAAAGFRDPQREAGSGLGLTWPANDSVPPLFRIDWILARGLEPVAAWVPPPGPSDHHPVAATLSLEESS